jgi:putative oxidoreductase
MDQPVSPTEEDRIAPAERLLFPGLRGFYVCSEKASYALLRVALGIIILTHGLPKALGYPHGSNLDPFNGLVNTLGTKLGLPGGTTLALLVTFVETVGAAGISLGFFTRLFAPMLAIEMLVACQVHKATFPWIDRGFEMPLTLGLVALYVALRGGGRYSIDYYLKKQL